MSDTVRQLALRCPPSFIAGEPVADIVQTFAKDLIEDRLRLTPTDGGNSTQLPKNADWLIDILLAAALLTSLYFRIRALSYRAQRRPNHDDEAILDSKSRSWRIIEDDCILPCREVMKNLKEQAGKIAQELAPQDYASASLKKTLENLLTRVLSGICPPVGQSRVRIGLTDIHSLSEFAWFCLTVATGAKVYPGWSDLLLDLSNYDSSEKSRIGTPQFDSMTYAQEFIVNRYRAITEASWQQLREPHYLAAARLLNRQHEYRQEYRLAKKQNQQPPLSTAFVASFDLELELSLLSMGRPFTIALPVHVLNAGEYGLARTCWIALRIGPATKGKQTQDRLNELLKPDLESWDIIDHKCGEDGPVVIRLAGCPLIRLPRLQDQDCDPKVKSFKDKLIDLLQTSFKLEAGRMNLACEDELVKNLQLQHAVVINEHDAILQSELDLISIPASEDGKFSERERPRCGLRADFAAGNKKWSRFWMMLGVQIHDAAFRYRLATLISSLPLAAELGTGSSCSRTIGAAEEGKQGVFAEGGSKQRAANPAGRHIGVTVNMHSTELEQDLLFWNGFDIVHGAVSEFACDLTHYTKHLRFDERIIPNGACDVGND